MNTPATSGSVAQLLGISEPHLNDLVRRNKVSPAPPVAAGRRFWSRNHIRQAAEALGALTPAFEAQLDADADLASHA